MAPKAENIRYLGPQAGAAFGVFPLPLSLVGWRGKAKAEVEAAAFPVK